MNQLWVVLLASFCLCLVPGTSRASLPLSPYSDFQRLSRRELASVKGRLTLVGGHTRDNAGSHFSVAGHAPDLGVFRPFLRPELIYQLSYAFPFTVTLDEMKNLIDRLADLPAVRGRDSNADHGVSIALAASVGDSVKVFEVILADMENRRALSAIMLQAFAENGPARELMTRLACTMVGLPGSSAADVTEKVSIQVRGFRKDRATGRYIGTVRVTNTSDSALAAPVLFVFTPSGNVESASADGQTCAIWPPADYQILPVRDALQPGHSVEAVLQFDNSEEEFIELFKPRVCAGPGFR